MKPYDLELPAGLDSEVALLVGVWQDSTREWLGEMGEVSDAAVTWSAGQSSPSIGALMLHMMDAENAWIRETMLGLAARESEALQIAAKVNVDERDFPAPPAWPFARYVELLREYRADLIDLLKDKRATDWVTSPRGNRLTVRWILGHLIQHDSYHGGQCVLLHEAFCRLSKQ